MYKCQLDPVVYQNLPRFLHGNFAGILSCSFSKPLGEKLSTKHFPALQVWRIKGLLAVEGRGRAVPDRCEGIGYGSIPATIPELMCSLNSLTLPFLFLFGMFTTGYQGTHSHILRDLPRHIPIGGSPGRGLMLLQGAGDQVRSAVHFRLEVGTISSHPEIRQMSRALEVNLDPWPEAVKVGK